MSESTYATGIVGAPAPILSFGPLVLPVPGRAVDLQVRVSAPRDRERAAGHPALARPRPLEPPLAAVARLTWANLRTELYPGDSAWQDARDELAASPDPLGRVESKQA